MKNFLLICSLLIISSTMSLALIIPCVTNSETKVSKLKSDTILMIENKSEYIRETTIKNYKEALEKKKEMMIEMLKIMQGIELLMKKNQVERKKMIKLWDNIVKTQSISVQ